MAPTRRARLFEDDDYGDDKESNDARVLDFAKDALAKTAMIAADLAARNKVCAAGCLAANLLIAKSVLNAAGVHQLPKLQRRLPKLLDDLEYVCSWPNRPSAHTSLLEELLNTSFFQRWSQKQAEEQARRGILAFCKARQDIRDQYLKKLQRFAEIVMAVDDDNESRRKKATDEETPDAYPTHVNTALYSVLKSHSLCTCTWKGGPGAAVRRGHHARLRLNDKMTKIDGCIAFDMLFAATPIVSDHWQELQMRVAMRKKARKAVHYHEETSTSFAIQSSAGSPKSEMSERERSRLILPESFCRLVKTRIGSRICCRVQDEELHQLYDGAPLKQQIGPGSSMSLREVMAQCKLSNRMKLVLAYILARSFWQYYDSPWMSCAWSSDSIHFLRESPLDGDDDNESVVSDSGTEISKTDGALFASRPYLAIDFIDQGTEPPMEYCDSYSVIYRYPRLLALCMILLEIAQGSGLVMEDQGSIEANLNESWTMTRRYTKRSRLRKDFDFPDYRKAILSCLNYKPDDQTAESTTSNIETDVFARKAMVYSSVVQPLERLLKNLGFAENLHIIDPIDMSRSPDRVVKLPAAAPVESLISQKDQGNTNTQASAQWLDDISSINASIRELKKSRKSKERGRPVRIAVLDTGYDGDTMFFTFKERKRRIKGWKDYAESSSTPVDSSGHGTHTLALIMKVAPTADIYVARIAKDRAGLQNSADNIAQAITWAATEAEADIISMAFGFPEEIPLITTALLTAQLARNNQLLFLAAASNSGGNRRETFPAALDSVISVRETNHNGAFSDSNPAVDPHGPIVFGTVGKDVPSAWLSSVAGEVPKSGSSVAIAVAAGLIAMVLEFVGVGMRDEEMRLPKEMSRAWTRTGMVNVLTRMSHDMGNRSYFISPDEWAENRLAEFNLWTANSGVFAGDRASLDARLALQPEVTSVFISLLTALNERLTQCQYFGNADFTTVSDESSSTCSSEVEDEAEKQEAVAESSESEDKLESLEHGFSASPEDIPRAFSPWSDDSDLSTDLDEDSRDAGSRAATNPSLDGPKVDVAQVIDHLARLTLAIRKASNCSRTHKADRRFEADDQPAFRRHLNVVVLATGMEEGRNRFLYAQRHARKLAAEAEPQNAPQRFQFGDDMPIIVVDQREPKPEEDIVPEPEEQASEAIKAPAQVVVKTVPEPALETQPPILSATSASGMTQAIDPGFIHNVTPSQVAKTEITTTSAKIAYPKPPAMPLGMRFFKCPCCCQSLPEMYRQPSLWKKHLMTDIAPYTCIIEDCPTPDRLFVTRAEWDQHTRNDHQKCWQCLPCTTIGKAPLVFPSVETFMEHLRGVHSDTINEEQYSTLIPESARPVPTGISCCPLCNSNGPADSPILLNHIAEHLHSFALRSLPWPGRESLRTNHDKQDDPDDLGDVDDDDADSYFLYNDYFDQGSEAASRQYNLTSGSNRDSDGLPSLHSSQASERPATPSDKGSEVVDATSHPPDYNAVVEPGEPLPNIEASYDDFKGTPIELVPSADSLPEVVEGEWSQKCNQRSPTDTDDPEVIRLRELMLNCMQLNYKRKAEIEGPESQMSNCMDPHNWINPHSAYHSPFQDLLVKVAELEARGNLTEAILCQTDIVNHFRDELGFAHYFIIENVDKLAEMHWDALDKEEADDYLSKEVEIFIDNVSIRGFQDPVWTINGAYLLATVCAKYRLASLADKLFNGLIDGFEQESQQLKDRIQHAEAAREKYSDFLKDQSRWGEVVAMERNLVARASADPYLGLDTTRAADALSRLAHALRQTCETQEADMIDEKIKAIRLFGQERESHQIEALRILERIRRAEIQTLGPWNPASLPTLTCLFRFYSYMGFYDDAIDAAQEMVICNGKIWGEGGLASIDAVKELACYYSQLFDWEKAKKARDLYNWLTVKNFDMAKDTKPYLDLGPEELDQRAPRTYARPRIAAGSLMSKPADTSADYGSSAPSGPAKEAPTSERRSMAASFSKALRVWRRDKSSD
ncbi:hypothetical protein QQS21_012243 [Conoideocrella luteorostrata]|uniref:Peptidase S8/S53 domain-containing protein n=1 Tax=Conoideocrella luteorostrata TaxID=1105319 RepID=A0AAJ0FMU5_9HYPO|nr:hypothetical protein QQS21_012243 [Conoideocrella luteorostrata]